MSVRGLRQNCAMFTRLSPLCVKQHGDSDFLTQCIFANQGSGRENPVKDVMKHLTWRLVHDGRDSLGQNFRFEFPNFPFVKRNRIFHFKGQVIVLDG